MSPTHQQDLDFLVQLLDQVLPSRPALAHFLVEESKALGLQHQKVLETDLFGHRFDQRKVAQLVYADDRLELVWSGHL